MIWLLAALLVVWVALGPWVLVAAAVLMGVPRVRWWVLDRVRLTRRGLAFTAATVAVLTGLVVVLPDGLLPIPQSPGVLATPSYVGRPASPNPVRAGEVPQHPHLAANGASSMHDDAWASDAYAGAGPLGAQPEVETAWFGIEECATLTFDRDDRLVALCGDTGGPSLHVIDPESMRKLASLDLPEREESDRRPWEDLCGGAYMYLDDRDRAVLATTDRRVLVVRTADGEGKPELTTDDSWDLKPYVPHGDCLIALLPDWSGRIWWLSQHGLVGTIEPRTGDVEVHDLKEEIWNSFAVDESGGVYVVSDTALHRLEAGAGGRPRVVWRTAYDRGAERKPGQLSRGSGTTPTLLDGDVVAITDNAEPRMNVVFLDRRTGREICRQPVFAKGESATENSLVSLGSGVLVENNHGYRSPLSTVLGFATEPGLARVDLAGGKCELRWTSDQVAPTSVPKASWATGLAYTYTKRPSWTGVSAWYVTATDVETGRVRWSVRTGLGTLLNNHYAAITLGPDSSLWIATLGGLVRVRDRS
ncbi:MAG: PQQ-binding-like beta-propeller repeat protein [Nocardioides sp.]|nr:PQQ-binding-like beta-propeller repeat protein [Nocardioides sp.]